MQRAHAAPTAVRDTGPTAPGVPGKATLAEHAYDGVDEQICTPSGDVCFKAPPRGRDTLLAGLFPANREEAERLIAEAIADDQRDVCGALPLGGVFFGSKRNYRRAIAIDRFEMQRRTLTAMEASPPAAIVAVVMQLHDASDAHIMEAAEATALAQAIAGSIARTVIARGNQPQPAAREPAPAPARRDRKLVDDLKRRSVPTNLDGSPNPEFDPNTPSFIAGHFKSEQVRTGSNSPRDWKNPKGFDAQHPNGHLFAHEGEPEGTRLHWGTTEDNQKLQKPRELGQTPHARPKPLP